MSQEVTQERPWWHLPETRHERALREEREAIAERIAQREARRLAPRKCEGCGKTFEPKSARHRFCVPQCRRPKPQEPATCEGCGATFLRRRGTTAYVQRFCSRRCAARSRIYRKPKGQKS